MVASPPKLKKHWWPWPPIKVKKPKHCLSPYKSVTEKKYFGFQWKRTFFLLGNGRFFILLCSFACHFESSTSPAHWAFAQKVRLPVQAWPEPWEKSCIPERQWAQALGMVQVQILINREFLAGLEQCWFLTAPMQPDRSWAVLQRGMGTYCSVPVCKVDGDPLCTQTQGWNWCQRCIY